MAVSNKIKKPLGRKEDPLKQLRRIRAVKAVERIQSRSVKIGLERTTLAEINQLIQKTRRVAVS
jgi:hypothetical protein